MTLYGLSLGGAFVTLDAVDSASAALLTRGFPALTRSTASGGLVARLVQLDDDRFAVTVIGSDGAPPGPTRGLDGAETLSMLSGLIAEQLATRSNAGVALHAGAVRFGDRVVLLPGASGAGKSTASVQLALAGGEMLTDELVWLGGVSQIEGLLRPVGLKRPVDARVALALQLPELGPDQLATPFVRLLDARHLSDQQNHAAAPEPVELALIVFPDFDPERRSGVHAVSPIEATERLLGHRWVTPERRGPTFHQLAEVARRVPAVEVVGSRLDDIVSVVEALLAGDDIADLGFDEPDEPTALARPSFSDLDLLSSLAISHGCDQWMTHRFTPEDHRRFAARRHEIRLIAEISTGVDDDIGMFHNSLRMWRDYFPNAVVIGVTQCDAAADLGPRIETRSLGAEGDQCAATWEFSEPLDLVVHRDAADRVSADGAFDAIFSRLRDGGLYAIECAPGARGVTSFFCELIDDLHLPERRALDEQAVGSRHAESIRGVDVTRNLCLVERGANRRRSNLISRLDEPAVRHTVDVLVQATRNFRAGRAELALARLHHSMGEHETMLVWARAALVAGSIDPWVMAIVKQNDIAASTPHR